MRENRVLTAWLQTATLIYATHDVGNRHSPWSPEVFEQLGFCLDCDLRVHCYDVQIGPFDVQFGPQDRSDRTPLQDNEVRYP